MKTAKKLTALLIVLTLLFALSVTALADFNPQTQYRIKFFVNGTEMNSWEIIGNVGDSVYTAIMANDNPRGAVFTTVSGNHKALQSIENIDTEHASYDDIPLDYFDLYEDIRATSNPYYFLLETGAQGYHYLYLGYAWTYQYEGGGDLWLYMDQCFPAANNVMEVRYSLQDSDFWQMDPIN